MKSRALERQPTTARGAGAPPPPALKDMKQNARDAANFLKAMAHENRLMILCYLSVQERSVTELEQLLDLNQATVSQQLARLRLEGLVEARRDGRAIHYSLADDATRALIQVLYAKFCRA